MIRFLLILFSISTIAGLTSVAQAQEGGMRDVKILHPIESVDSLNQDNIEGSNALIETEKTPSLNKEQRLNELKKKLEQLHQLTPSENPKGDFGEENKVKDNKKDLSFNIFYYLIYKYKQVDVFGS